MHRMPFLIPPCQISCQPHGMVSFIISLWWDVGLIEHQRNPPPPLVIPSAGAARGDQQSSGATAVLYCREGEQGRAVKGGGSGRQERTRAARSTRRRWEAVCCVSSCEVFVCTPKHQSFSPVIRELPDYMINQVNSLVY